MGEKATWGRIKGEGDSDRRASAKAQWQRRPWYSCKTARILAKLASCGWSSGNPQGGVEEDDLGEEVGLQIMTCDHAKEFDLLFQ